MKWTPHDYQKVGVRFMVGNAVAGLLLRPGLGKTSITLAAFKTLRRAGAVNRMLVIAPLRPAYSVWPAEVAQWDDFRDLSVAVLHGPKKEEALRSGADISVINPEGLPWLLKVAARPSPRSPWPWEMLVVDESTRFKHANTQRFKMLKPYLPMFKRRFILTGSPAPNGLIDLFGQVYILDLGNALGQYITHYRLNYFVNPDGQGWQWVPQVGAEERIYKKLKPLVLRFDERELLSMPPLIGVDPPLKVMVDLPDPAMRMYKQMEDQLIAAVNNELVVAANAAAATTKCRQIANGGIYAEGGSEWSHVHEAKVDAVEEIIEELQGRPALVAYEYRHDLERLRKRFPDAPWIGGGVAPGRFRTIERAWNAGSVPVLLAQPQSVAHGLNLQGTGASVIWHSLTWDLEVYEQFIRRVWRQGQKEKVTVHHIVARGTVDEVMIKALAAKDKTQRTLLDALKTHLRGR